MTNPLSFPFFVNQWSKCASELKARMVAHVNPIFSQNFFAGTRKCTSQSDSTFSLTRISISSFSLHCPHPHGVCPFASLFKIAEMPKTSHIQLAKYVFVPVSALKFVGRDENGWAIQMEWLPGAKTI